MSTRLITLIIPGLLSLAHPAAGAEAEIVFSGEKRLNNLVSELLVVSSPSRSTKPLVFTRPRDGWLLVAAQVSGTGRVRIVLDKESRDKDGESGETLLTCDAAGPAPHEAMRWVRQGLHTLVVECQSPAEVENLSVRAIPELMHCGLGFNSAIKSYGLYDAAFLKTDILPNVTTLVVPSNIQLTETMRDDWHRQGKKFVAEAGINGQSKIAEEHAKYWNSFYERMPFLDGIIINEFIVNNPWPEPIGPERRERIEAEKKRYEVYNEAIRQVRADTRYQNKMLYAYIGGSGKKLNQEVIGTNFIRTILNCGYRVALERYLHEMSSEQGSAGALQTFVDGITDWETKEPGVKKQMVIAFGLFSMPPGGLNKQPNVDYHVWMDQQMQAVAQHPALADIGGLEWWTSLQADEETVRFVGKLYRHYGLQGQTNRLTQDPLFLSHVQNGDFEKGTNGWTLRPAEEGTMAVKSFPRYGRIEGRFMGLGRPADPEHIGDTFLTMKRSARGPNTFSQEIRNLQPGRLYSLKMFSCDHDDLVNPKLKKIEETKSTGTVLLEGVDVDTKKSFTEVYASSPEPKIPVCITYYWMVFRAKGTTGRLTVSDWRTGTDAGPFGQEQTFNFLEIEPYHE
jgi:hypothetical protein